jgi:6-pyruvoyltetrahydropterin/6-carboxytetrahydropterin synthase
VHHALTGARVARVKHRIALAREQYKFSCAHMTVFPDGTKERLHGHNYTISVEIEVDRIDLKAMVPFAPIKDVLSELCAQWKDHILLAAKNPHFEVIRDADEIEFKLCGDRYVMPRGDVLILPIDNVSVEALSAHLAVILRERIRRGPTAQHIKSLVVTVGESPGQSASCEIDQA